MARDIILTGIPRAGTTLAAQLLDLQIDTVCLGEPEWQRPHPSLDANGFAEAIAQDFSELRKKLLAGIPVKDRRGKDGESISNYYESTGEENFDIVDFTRAGLTPEFTLAIKHNGPYLAVLGELIALKRFEIRAVIRHPLPVLRSWRRLDLPVSRGELPNATPYWPEMHTLTASRDISLLEKQVRMLELMMARIRHYEHQLTVIRYEEIAGDAAAQAASQPGPEDEAILAMLKQWAPNVAHYYPLE